MNDFELTVPDLYVETRVRAAAKHSKDLFTFDVI